MAIRPTQATKELLASHIVPAVSMEHHEEAILDAAVQRQDDLREMQGSFITEVLRLRGDIADERETHQKELRTAEAARIDAIRGVDVAAVAAAASVSASQAATLAAQVVSSAEAMRTQVAAVAVAAASGQEAALNPIKADIADLRKTQWEGAGRGQQVTESRDERGDKRGTNMLIVAGIGVFVSFSIGFGSLIIGVATYLTFHK